MIITIKMKDAAATAMARKVFKPQMDQYMETARETILAGFEHLHGPASRRARDSGVEFAYLTTRKRLSLSTVVTKTGNAYPQSLSVAWVTNAFFSINDYPGFGVDGHNRIKTLKVVLDEGLVVPSAEFGGLSISDTGEDSQKLIEDVASLSRRVHDVLKGADDYEKKVRSVLGGIRTYKQLGEVFPEAVPFFPAPKPKAKQIVPVELINELSGALK